MRVTYSTLLGFQFQFPEHELSKEDQQALLFELVKIVPVSVLKQLRSDLDKIIPALDKDYG